MHTFPVLHQPTPANFKQNRTKNNNLHLLIMPSKKNRAAAARADKDKATALRQQQQLEAAALITLSPVRTKKERIIDADLITLALGSAVPGKCLSVRAAGIAGLLTRRASNNSKYGLDIIITGIAPSATAKVAWTRAGVQGSLVTIMQTYSGRGGGGGECDVQQQHGTGSTHKMHDSVAAAQTYLADQHNVDQCRAMVMTVLEYVYFIGTFTEYETFPDAVMVKKGGWCNVPTIDEHHRGNNIPDAKVRGLRLRSAFTSSLESTDGSVRPAAKAGALAAAEAAAVALADTSAPAGGSAAAAGRATDSEDDDSSTDDGRGGAVTRSSSQQSVVELESDTEGSQDLKPSAASNKREAVLDDQSAVAADPKKAKASGVPVAMAEDLFGDEEDDTRRQENDLYDLDQKNADLAEQNAYLVRELDKSREANKAITKQGDARVKACRVQTDAALGDHEREAQHRMKMQQAEINQLRRDLASATEPSDKSAASKSCRAAASGSREASATAALSQKQSAVAVPSGLAQMMPPPVDAAPKGLASMAPPPPKKAKIVEGGASGGELLPDTNSRMYVITTTEDRDAAVAEAAVREGIRRTDAPDAWADRATIYVTKTDASHVMVAVRLPISEHGILVLPAIERDPGQWSKFMSAINDAFPDTVDSRCVGIETLRNTFAAGTTPDKYAKMTSEEKVRHLLSVESARDAARASSLAAKRGRGKLYPHQG